MANDKTIDYQITADPQGFEAGMKKAVDSAKNARSEIEGNFGQLANLLQGQFGQVAKILTLVGGGVYFKAAIDETKKLTGEANALAKTLNISATEASFLNTALGDIYADTETYITSSQKLAKTLRSDEEALNAMGLKTRDAAGEYRNMNDLMLDAIALTNDHKEGTDRNLAAMTLFGKGAGEAAGLLKLNADKIEAAKIKAEELNLTISQEGVEANRQYKETMNDLGDVMSGMKKTVGEVLMPVFTDLGNWFAGTGPQKISVLKIAVESLVVVFRVAGLGIQTMARIVVLYFDQIKTTALGFSSVMSKVLSGDFAGAVAAGGAAIRQYKEKNHQAFVEVVADARIMNDKIEAMMAPKTAAQASKTTGKRSYVDPKASASSKTDPSIMAALEEKLAIEKDAFERGQQALGALQEFSKAQERDYWKAIQETTKLGANDKVSVNRKVLALEHDLRKIGFDAEIASSRAALEVFKQDHVSRLVILEQVHAKMLAMYGSGSKEELDASGEISKEKRKAAEQQIQIENTLAKARRDSRLAEIDDIEAQLNYEVQAGLRSAASQIAELNRLEIEKAQIRRKALLDEQQQLVLAEDFDREAMAKNKAAREELEIQHQNRLAQIKRQASLESDKNAIEAFQGIQQGLAATISATLRGTLTIGGFFKSMFQSIAGSIATMLGKMGAQWIIELAREKIRGALHALSQIKNYSAIAGAAAFASTAAIPIVGPTLAPAAASAAATATAGFAAMIPFAARGYDIPAGINPLTQLHQKEMVLPAEHADVIRGLAGQGVDGGAVHFHVNAMDSQDVARFFDSHASTLVKSLRQAQARGA